MANDKKKEDELIWIASIDIGKCNFAFCIEEINMKNIEKIKNISSSDRYNLDGTSSIEMDQILKTIYMNGSIILHKNLDISQNCKKGNVIEPELIHNMINTLDNYSEYWDKCSYIIVEQQMSFGKKINTLALKLGSTCQAYFYIKYGRSKYVIEFPAYNKTQVLGCKKLSSGITKTGKTKYKNIDKPARKKWAITKAKEILNIRGITDHPIIEAKRGVKLDDLSDVCLQNQAFIYKMFVEKSMTI